VYSGNTAEKRIEAKYKRNKLRDDLFYFRSLIQLYTQEKTNQETEAKIKETLQSSSAFTAFKRQIIKDDPELYAVFGE
jgi:hypothetical protein